MKSSEFLGGPGHGITVAATVIVTVTSKPLSSSIFFHSAFCEQWASRLCAADPRLRRRSSRCRCARDSPLLRQLGGPTESVGWCSTAISTMPRPSTSSARSCHVEARLPGLRRPWPIGAPGPRQLHHGRLRGGRVARRCGPRLAGRFFIFVSLFWVSSLFMVFECFCSCFLILCYCFPAKNVVKRREK